MPQHDLEPLRLSLVTSLGLRLDSLTTHAHLRELFPIQELLARHAADVAWQQSQQSCGPLPKDAPEMSAQMRAHLGEMMRQKALAALVPGGPLLGQEGEHASTPRP